VFATHEYSQPLDKLKAVSGVGSSDLHLTPGKMSPTAEKSSPRRHHTGRTRKYGTEGTEGTKGTKGTDGKDGRHEETPGYEVSSHRLLRKCSEGRLRVTPHINKQTRLLTWRCVEGKKGHNKERRTNYENENYGFCRALRCNQPICGSARHDPS
jgi:hypothetical protein